MKTSMEAFQHAIVDQVIEIPLDSVTIVDVVSGTFGNYYVISFNAESWNAEDWYVKR